MCKITILCVVSILLLYDVNSEIFVDNGRIKIIKDVCNLTINDLVMKNVSQVMGLHYGLIEYKCLNAQGSLISKMQCINCGLYCPMNELIVECKQTMTIWIIGIIISAIPSLISICLFKGAIKIFCHKLIDSIIYKVDKYKDDVELRKINSMNGRSNNVHHFKPMFKKPMSINSNNIKRIHDRRNIDENESKCMNINPHLDTSKNKADCIKNDKCEYIDILHPSNTNTDENKEISDHKLYPSLPPFRRSWLYLNIFTITICFLNLQYVSSCDNNLYVYSNGKVCDENSCVDSGMYNVPLLSGSITCFKDEQGEVMKVSLKKSYLRHRYLLSYYTSDYTIKLQHAWACKKPGSICWSGKCSKLDKHPNLKYDWGKYPTGHECITSGLGCDTWCFYGQACNWISWYAESVNVKYPVYKHISTIWEVEVLMSYRNITSIYKINNNNPRINLNAITYKIPLYITSFNSEIEKVDNGLVIINNKAYESKISMLNMPERDIIGDYQISLLNESETFNIDTVICKVEGCKPDCKYPESKIKRFVSMIDRLNHRDHIYINNEYSLETREMTNGLVNLLIGNVKFESLQVKKAVCEMDVSATFSCVGCTTPPYVILQTYNIKEEGIVQFESNCSFDKNYVSCNPDPYILKLLDDSKTCRITMSSINRTMIVNFNYTYLGYLDPTKVKYSDNTYTDALTSIVTSADFITSVTSTLMLSTVSMFLLTIISRITKVIMLNKIAKDQKNIDF